MMKETTGSKIVFTLSLLLLFLSLCMTLAQATVAKRISGNNPGISAVEELSMLTGMIRHLK